MSSLVRNAVAWTKTAHGRKLVRYTLVSVASTTTSIVVIAVVYGFRIVPNEVTATIVGNVVATIPSYNLNRKWTWGKTGRSHVRREVVPFWAIAALGIAFSILGASYAHHLVHTHHWSHLLDTVIVEGANFVSFAVFWVLKLIIFNRIFRVETLDDAASTRESRD
ncbi:MAG: GtrA family protein [Acidimicrobiales bacterium]